MDHQKAQKNLAPLLKPVGSLYSSLMSLRARLYLGGLKKSRKPKAFSVAVGNISWGGSGKTPLADWLLGWGKNRGLTTALLTRGYGGKSEERPLLVKPHSTPAQSGDEPLMLARSHPESYILADPRRSRALAWLEASTTANFIVLDDAMQHLAIGRDLNLVLLRAKDLTDEFWGKVIPAGEWREGPSALARASAFLLRMPPEAFAEAGELIKKRLAPYNKPIFSFDLCPAGLTALGKPEQPLKSLGGRAYALCTGVGSPEQVARSAEILLGAPPARLLAYPDHHKFTAADLKQMSKLRLPVVMTAKDAVKIEPLLLGGLEMEGYVLESRVIFGPVMLAGRDFESWLEERRHELA